LVCAAVARLSMDPFSFLAWRFWYFFRDPARHAPPGRNLVSPADGRILYVRQVASGSLPNPVKAGVAVPLEAWLGTAPPDAGGILIGIYMTPFSVHYNRAPLAGSVAAVAPRPAQGENLSMVRALMRLAWNMSPFEEGSGHILQNARNTIVIAGDFPVVVIQMADRFVREVDCLVAPGQRVEKGEKIGFIRMGSQCDLFIPASAGFTASCQPGDKVVAGETILGMY
jgi:phosphatidylserine decarboxylase